MLSALIPNEVGVFLQMPITADDDHLHTINQTKKTLMAQVEQGLKTSENI